MNTGWRKATASGDNAHCVKIRFSGADVLLGDSKNAALGDAEPAIRLPFATWRHTLTALPTRR